VQGTNNAERSKENALCVDSVRRERERGRREGYMLLVPVALNERCIYGHVM
jgi:hypothetical protein